MWGTTNITSATTSEIAAKDTSDLGQFQNLGMKSFIYYVHNQAYLVSIVLVPICSIVFSCSIVPLRFTPPHYDMPWHEEGWDDTGSFAIKKKTCLAKLNLSESALI